MNLRDARQITHRQADRQTHYTLHNCEKQGVRQDFESGCVKFKTGCAGTAVQWTTSTDVSVGRVCHVAGQFCAVAI